MHAYRLAAACFGPQIFSQPVRIIFDDGIGRIEDVAVRAVVLFQSNQVVDFELALKICHVGDVGTAKSVN